MFSSKRVCFGQASVYEARPRRECSRIRDIITFYVLQGAPRGEIYFIALLQHHYLSFDIIIFRFTFTSSFPFTTCHGFTLLRPLQIIFSLPLPSCSLGAKRRKSRQPKSLHYFYIIVLPPPLFNILSLHFVNKRRKVNVLHCFIIIFHLFLLSYILPNNRNRKCHFHHVSMAF